MGSHVFKWPYPAKDVHVTGTFDDWAKSVQMEKVGDEWIKEVEFASADEKVLYKFVVDDEWKVDANLQTEGDGHYNTNNVLHPQDIKRNGAIDVPGSFPETPANDNQTFSVQPIPGTGTGRNPITVAPGAPLPDQKDITSNTIESNVTTSKEDYENSGAGAMPAAETTEPQFSVNPIPATTGPGVTTSKEDFEKDASADMSQLKDEPTFSVNPIPATTGPSVTTSKEDYEKDASSALPESKTDPTFSVNPIPATGGVLTPDQKEVIPNTVESTVTTSKEDYENSGSGLPAFAAAGAAAAGGLGVAGLAAAHSESEKKNILPESGMPMGPGAMTAFQPSPFITSSATSATTADLAAKVPVEDTTTKKLADELEIPLKQSPFISSSGPGTTTAALAADVPLESTKTTAEPVASSAVPEVVKESISAAHGAPEAAASPEVVKEKADLEKELLSKTHPTQATGESAEAADDQTSYYGLATTVPPTVEKSMEKARAAPEAAADTSVVAEKSTMEKELLSKIPSTDEAGEPAPTIAAATSSTAPTTTAAEAATSITDGKTANEAVPDTDTSSAARGTSAGELAGGAVVGGAAAAGVATLAAKHEDADVEPPRVADSAKPDITTEASPATATTERLPGQSASAAAAISDGAATTPGAEITKPVIPIETTEAATTEYAPVRTGPAVPGVSSSAAAALSDGCEDPTLTEDAPALADEPAVKLMNQNEDVKPTSTPATTAAPPAVDSSSLGNKEPSALLAGAGIPTLTSAGTDTVEKKEIASPEAKAPTAPSTPAKQRPQSMAVSSPAASTATSNATDKKKKRHRFSAFIHKIFD